MRVLVTGGAGFIGSNYVRSLLAGRYPAFADAEVVVLDLLTYAGTMTNLPDLAGEPRLRFVHGDIRDAAAVAQVMAGADVVVHFAAESHVDRSISGAADFVSTNVVGTQVLLQAALEAGVSRFVHVSTDEVYGSIEHGPGRRRTRWSPTRRTRRPRPGPTCWPGPTTTRTGCRSASPAAPTTTGRTSSRRSSSRCS